MHMTIDFVYTTLQDIQTRSLDEEVSEFLQQPPQNSDAGLN